MAPRHPTQWPTAVRRALGLLKESVKEVRPGELCFQKNVVFVSTIKYILYTCESYIYSLFHGYSFFYFFGNTGVFAPNDYADVGATTVREINSFHTFILIYIYIYIYF